jgi:hypothetical protein
MYYTQMEQYRLRERASQHRQETQIEIEWTHCLEKQWKNSPFLHRFVWYEAGLDTQWFSKHRYKVLQQRVKKGSIEEVMKLFVFCNYTHSMADHYIAIWLCLHKENTSKTWHCSSTWRKECGSCSNWLHRNPYCWDMRLAIIQDKKTK